MMRQKKLLIVTGIFCLVLMFTVLTVGGAFAQPKVIKLKPTDDLPLVILDAKKNTFQISGKVLPEDGNVFFEPILNWVAEYVKKPNSLTEFYFRLDYYNSSTARMITKIIVQLEKIQRPSPYH